MFSKLQKSVIFLILWTAAGSTLGAITLLGPVAYLTRLLRDNKMDGDIEKIAVNSIIMLLIIVSAVIAGVISSWYSRSDYKYKLMVMLSLSAFFFAAPMALFFNPATLRPFMPAETSVSNFVFGPYPDIDILKKIKRDEYSAVISLLHPAVLPFEPQLLKTEEENCAKIGVTLIKVPMLPWISENKESLEKIAELAKSKKGKYYIHCYLGRDRVHMAKMVIQKHNAAADSAVINAGRKINDITFFERGDIHKFSGEVYLTPYPTDEEFLSFVLNGNFKSIVSLLDSKNADDAALIEKEKNITKMSPVELIFFPMSAECEDQSLYTRAVEFIKAAPRPVMIHGFKTDSKREKGIIERLKKL